MYQEYLDEINKVPTFSLTQIIIWVLIFFTAALLLWVLYSDGVLEIEHVMPVVAVLVFFGVGCRLYQNDLKSNILKEYKEKAPMEWVVKGQALLCTMSTENQSTFQAESGIFVSRISSDNFTEYKYVVKTEQGYQLRSLSNEYPSVSESEIYIKEEPSDISPKIIFEEREYVEKEFVELFESKSVFDRLVGSKDQRVTFVVPKGTVVTNFEKGSIK